MRVLGRLNRIAKVMQEKHLTGGQLRLVFQNCDETAEQAMTKAGIQADDNDLIVYIMKWGKGSSEIPIRPEQAQIEPELQETPKQLDDEIEEIKSELLKDGYSEQEILEMTESESELEPDDIVEENLQKPEPIKSDSFLTRMGR